jgi:nickel-type superoxide dismutase maturation protease
VLTLVAVEGQSMRPGLEDGDRLLVVRRRRYRTGDVVAARDPREPARVLVKRVVEVDGDRLVLHGDAPDASTDSRTFGPVDVGAVLGRAVYRYAPAGRAGRISRPRPPSPS